MTESSDFGKGFAYCLGLFLAHASNIDLLKRNSPNDAGFWFYGASDHLIELIIPDQIGIKKKLEIEKFVELVFEYRLSQESTWADVQKALSFAKNLLLYWDQVCGIEAVKSVNA